MSNRREFIQSIAGMATAGSLVAACSSPEQSDVQNMTAINKTTPLNFGVGLFTIPFMLQDDFAGSIKTLAAIGYKEVEIFGPYPFSVQAAHDFWQPIGDQLGIAKTGYYGHTPQEIRSILDDHGISSPSMHIDLVTLEERTDQVMEAMDIVGHKYAGIAAIPDELRQNLDGFKQVADRFNVVGEKLNKQGFTFLYHNHGYGLVEMEGEIPFNVVIERTSPDYVALEMDVYWTVAGRADPIAYLEAYPGRFKLMHVKDMQEKVHFEGDGGDAGQWLALFGYMADAGAGVLDLKEIIKKAAASGVDHFYLEKDLTQTPEETLQRSFDFFSQIT